jgi:chromosome segregation ATPase
LEVENVDLKAKSSQAIEQAAKGYEDHRQAREEWLASCAKVNDELKNRTEANQRYRADAEQAGRRLLEKESELEVMSKVVADVDEDKDRLVAEVKQRTEGIFWLLDQGIAGAVQTFRSNSEYV